MIDLDEHTITAEVLRRIKGMPDPRLREILNCLITHLHDFARESRLSEAEWLEGVKFLSRTGQISNDLRQEMILAFRYAGSVAAGCSAKPQPAAACVGTDGVWPVPR